MAIDDYCDPEWPPGTVRLQTLLHSETKETETEIVLQPRPTSDPNDPLSEFESTLPQSENQDTPS